MTMIPARRKLHHLKSPRPRLKRRKVQPVKTMIAMRTQVRRNQLPKRKKRRSLLKKLKRRPIQMMMTPVKRRK